ncbi:MAG: dTDP-4-dehydrorhamnose 3,5-epimerase [Devosia sp.]
MKATPLRIRDVLRIEPRAFEDERGVFFESFNARAFVEAVGHAVEFVQDNQSVSRLGVVRGLHYQLPPAAQGKLVRVAAGAVFDVALDIRRSSSSFGQWVGETLSADNRRQLYIPAGFAHGFVALSEDAVVIYKATAFYSPADERAIRWDDPGIGIAWPLAGTPLVSAKDMAAPPFQNADTFA